MKLRIVMSLALVSLAGCASTTTTGRNPSSDGDGQVCGFVTKANDNVCLAAGLPQICPQFALANPSYTISTDDGEVVINKFTPEERTKLARAFKAKEKICVDE